MQGGYLYYFVAKIFNSGDFILRFFHLSRRKFEGGYTCDFHLALATRQNLKKSHHLREQKIARVAAALPIDVFSIGFLKQKSISFGHYCADIKLTNVRS